MRYVVSVEMLDLARKRRGLSMRQLAEKAGVSRNLVWHLMAHRTETAPEVAIRALADALGVDAPLIADIPEGLW